jgi:hypothetical protein
VQYLELYLKDEIMNELVMVAYHNRIMTEDNRCVSNFRIMLLIVTVLLIHTFT